ncbi:MAG: acyl-CoA dehydratase activase [Lachnospiraceae bacterium]|nr:acyl-CoA dehydratase activase [Lachnospiraceae bacterium]
MIGYICKYTPIEVFEAMGEEVRRIEPEAASFNQADTLMHPNICSFAKGLLEDVLEQHYDGIILTTCCDSIRRVYDVLREKLPDTFVYILDIPRITKDAGIGLYEKRIRRMIQEYEAYTGKQFKEERLLEVLREKRGIKGEEAPLSLRTDRLNVGILGARANESICRILEQHHVNVAFDLTCTGLKRKLLIEEDNLLPGYVRGLLTQFPCMRMEAAAGRDQLIQTYGGSVDGVIYHTVQFCDNYSYEYAWLKEGFQKPLLLLETDYTRQSYGQILTRVEAFLESLQKGETGSAGKRKKIRERRENDTMYVLGVDSGSTSTNAVIMDQDRKIRAFSVVRTGAKSGESAERILKEVLEKAGLKQEDLTWIVSTGYGRVSIPYADENVTEISCHGRGAHYFNPKIRTILDIGGQDSKAIKLDERGEVTDFVMNDKCAAGTGRFLEAIARTLEIDISQVGPAALTSTEDIEITSMCTVFAESEVISLIANNKEKGDIANGICRAIANKAYSLMKRVGLEPDYMMTGGVAKNPGVVRAVEDKLQAGLYICPEPEIVGAVGAALYALDCCNSQADPEK